MMSNSVFFSQIGFISEDAPLFALAVGVPVDQYNSGSCLFDQAGNPKSQHEDGSRSDRFAAGSNPKQGFNTDWMKSKRIQNIWAKRCCSQL
jgi:hypothetical protein